MCKGAVTKQWAIHFVFVMKRKEERVLDKKGAADD